MQKQNYDLVAKIVSNAMESNDRFDKSQRILAWKRDIRKSSSQPYNFLRSKAKAPPTKVSMVDGKPTAETCARLDSIAKVWKEIYSHHQNGEPSFRAFMETYGPTLRASAVKLDPISPKTLGQTINNMNPSAPGLDQITAAELQIAANWSPDILESLTVLFQTIERSQKWPTVLTKGAVVFIPKEADNPFPTPYEFRPITILSCIYRVWAATRHTQMAQNWFPLWQHPNSFGSKGSLSADQLAYETCVQLEDAQRSGHFVAGISFDLQKCFDTIPFNLALDVFLIRCADSRIVQTLRAFYSQHIKKFKLEGHFPADFKPCCGIVQGCPLSMLLLTSLITSWLEYTSSQIPSATLRAYADDMSGITEAQTKHVVSTDIRGIYKHTTTFSKLAGMTISQKKPFTFGDKNLKNMVPEIEEHKTIFRLVGCSIKIPNQLMWTALEKQRQHAWQYTVHHIQLLPISWQHKTQIIQSMMAKLSFGQGMHILYISKDNLRAMRAVVVSALLNVQNYNSAPSAIFALLTSPSLDPEFNLHLSAFNLIRRMHPNPADVNKLNHALQNFPANIDGPTARVQQLIHHPVFGPTMNRFLQGQTNPQRWQHLLREDYRTQVWKILTRDRPQHFAGTSGGVDRPRTLALLKILMQQADDLQKKCDADLEINPDPLEDPRAKLKVLRLLLTGGLQNPERQHRHKKQAGKVLCTCGHGEPDLLHISWHCSKFQDIRSPILSSILPDSLDTLPVCFTCCTIVPTVLQLSTPEVIQIQSVLIRIWQSHIDEWYNGPDNFIIENKHVSDQPDAHNSSSSHPHQPHPTVSSSSSSVTHHTFPKNGHVLKISEDGGVFCQKCGKYTKYLKHQRLKILSKPCKNASLPPDQWLQKPGAMRNNHRLTQAWHDLQTQHNKGGHKLTWNQKCGKDRTKESDFGRLWCETCGKEWPWMHRHCNLPSAKYNTPAKTPKPPAWVLAHRNDPHRVNLPDLLFFEPAPVQNPVPKRRIVGKQTVSFGQAEPTPCVAASSSDALPRTGVG